ncbi:PAS domain-containing sensor histidine kinase [Clostridium fungisolvens]|uniref:histidine kinase n=1 Tax=Clostridium fungisolvens TaxID=1604897 RepID=A0A6V8SKI9_9CLOT|nr:PAS domain-containing sensor histidine kinase [Clostridium fungisolvens]GFP75658.1 Adaptive-response sensory-kinase SasA [Clostridium fungisolvens]
MDANLIFNKIEPFIVEDKGVITEVDYSLLQLTGYNEEDFLCKNINEVWKLLTKTDLDVLKLNKEIIIFTKDLEAKIVTIIKCEENFSKKVLYKFIQKYELSFEERHGFLEKLIIDERFGIGIHLAQDFTLIKSNETFLKFFEQPFRTKEMCYGKKLSDLIPSFSGSKEETIWKGIVSSNQSCYMSERKGLLPDNDRYWDYNIIPISEDGEVKYVVAMIEDVTARVSSREHIRVKNEQLEAVFDSVEDIIIMVDKDENYLGGNKSSKALYDLYKRNRKLEDARFKVYNYDREEVSLEQLDLNLVREGKAIKNTKIIVELENDIKYYELSGNPIFDESGNVSYGVFILHDITKEVIRTKVIEKQNRELEAIIECVDDVVTVVDKDGRYIRKSTKEGNKYVRDNQVFSHISSNTKFYDFDGNLIPVEQLCTARLLRGEKIKNYKSMTTVDDEEIYISVSAIPIFDDLGQFEMGVMVTHDISELMQSYVKIEKQKKELEVIIENMRDGLTVLDKNGNVIRINKAFTEIMKKGMTVKPTFSYVSETMKFGQVYYNEKGEVLSKEELPSIRVLNGERVEQQRVMVKNGAKNYYVDFYGTPIYDKNGQLQYGIIIGHHITEMMEKEKKIREQQELLYKAEKSRREALEKALIMKDEFISLITHEFKTPLNVIYSAIQLIEHVYIKEIPERVSNLIGNIKQNTFRQLRLVNNLLDITRLNSGHFKINLKNVDIVYLTGMITDSVKLYANQKKINLSFNTNVKSKFIAMDDEKYERIILNLLSNAIKFTPEDGAISVTINADNDKDRIFIIVKDTGIGIPKAKKNIIFERFGQVDSNLSRQAEGTGIGLSLVKLLVENLDGTISVESEIGAGSSFTVGFPMKEYVENEKNYNCVDADTRLITAISVEFSDIYF